MAVSMIQLHSREEWLEKRNNTVGGSDVSAILGMNPYCTNVELYEIKTGKKQQEDISEKPYVKYGNQAEMYLRGLFRLDFPEYRVEYVENNLWKNSEYPWGHYSADGWMYDKEGRLGILEIKTSEVLSSQHKEKWKGECIPDNYYIQVLHGMLIMEAEFAILKAQLKTVFDGVPYLQTKHYFIERSDVEADIDYLAQEEKKFWKHVQERKIPALILPEI
jgi:putative phage-type endonuclease